MISPVMFLIYQSIAILAGDYEDCVKVSQRLFKDIDPLFAIQRVLNFTGHKPFWIGFKRFQAGLGTEEDLFPLINRRWIVFGILDRSPTSRWINLGVGVVIHRHVSVLKLIIALGP